MTSGALHRWQHDRADLLDELVAAHSSLGGTGVGRRWTTGELNRALLLRVAAQFQGFARDLHQEAAVTFGALAQPEHPAIARVIAAGLQTNRELDRANAQENSLANDFGRFGVNLWEEMEALHVHTVARRRHLRFFNTARNGLAHDDPAKITAVEAAGYRIDLTWVKRWRSALDGLADTMDRVLATHLAILFDTTAPW